MATPNQFLRTVLSMFTPRVQATWTPASIRSALSEHELGQFANSATLIDAMGRGDRYTAVRDTLVKGLLGLPFSMEPADDSQRALDIAEDMTERWPRLVPNGELCKLVSWWVEGGVGFGDINYTRETGEWEPRLRTWHPSWAYFDETPGHMFYQITTPEFGIIPVTPGDGKWIQLETGSRGYMNGVVRSLALLWHIREVTWFDWARWSERHGLAIIKAKHPTDEEDDAVDEYWEDIQAMGRDASVLLPQGPDGRGFDLELLEAKAQSWQGFKELKESAGRSMAIKLLGQNLTTEIDAGSLAAASVHKNVQSDRLRGLARELEQDLFTQFVQPVARILYDGGADLAPMPKWDTTPPENQRELSEAAGEMADAIKTLAEAGYEVKNIDEVAARFGLELEQAEPLGQPQEPPPGEPPPPEGEQGPGEDEGEEEELQASQVQLQSGDTGRDAAAFVDGQDHADRLVDNGIRAAGRVVAPDLAAVLDAIDGAETFQDMRERLLQAFSDMDPDDFADVLEKALVLAELGGQHSVLTGL